MHVERLAAARRPEAEEIRIVGDLLPAFLSADVDGHGHALAVRVPDLQGSVLALLDPFLIHKAGGRIAQGQETVVVRTEAITVARKGVHEELQLIVGPLADVDALAAESVLNIVRAFVDVRIAVRYHADAEVAVDKLLAFPGNHLLHLLDVLDGHLVGRAGNAGMAVLLLFQRRHLFLLTRDEDHLIVNHGPCLRNGIHGTDQIHRHRGVVDLDAGERPDKGGERHAVHIHEGVETAAAVPEVDSLVIHLQPRHGDGSGSEIEGEVPVNVIAGFLLAQETATDSGILELVLDLAHLQHEIPPLAGIIGEELAAPAFLRDDQIRLRVGILPPVEIAEITVGKKLTADVSLIAEAPAAEDVLLVHGVSLAQCLGNGGEQGRELVVRVDVRGVLLNRVVHLQDGGVVAVLCVEHADPFHFLHREVDVLEDTAALASGTEGEHRDGHPDEDRHENKYHIQNHFPD